MSSEKRFKYLSLKPAILPVWPSWSLCTFPFGWSSALWRYVKHQAVRFKIELIAPSAFKPLVL